MKSKTYTLSELATIKYGKNQKKVVSDNGTVPIYGTGGLIGYAAECLYDKPSVLIGRKGTINKVRYIEEPFWTVDTLFYTQINDEVVLPRYLYYALSLINLEQHNEGTTIPSLRSETLNSLKFDIPSTQEQKKILSYIVPIEKKIKLNNEINNNLLEQALTLYATYFAESEKNGCIGDYCSIKSGYAFKSSWWTDNGIKVIKIGSINQDNLNLLECSYVEKDKADKAKAFTVGAGDLLIAMTGATIGKFAMVPYCSENLLVNQRVGKFFLGNNPVERLPFIYCTLKQPDVHYEIINRGQGSAQPNISATDIMSIPCVVPPKEVISEFNETTQPLFKLIIGNQQENRQLSTLRDTLLPKLMSGELDVCTKSFSHKIIP